MDTIPPIEPIVLTSDNNFTNYILIVDAYLKITKLYSMEKMTT